MFRFRNKQKTGKEENTNNSNSDNSKQNSIPASISESINIVKSIFKNSSDINIKPIETPLKPALIVYVDGLINQDLLQRDIISPLKSKDFDGNINLAMKTPFTEVTDISDVVKEVLQGKIALFYEDIKKIFIFDIKQWDKRSVETPETESTIYGPKEGFTESIRTNTALLRRKLRTPNLIIESSTIGRQGNSQIGIAYLEGIVNKDVLNELKSRLSKIDTDAVFSSRSILQYIEENTYSPISGIGTTQKPDIVAARILEGRVALFCDGSPHVLTIPELFIENLQTGDDYYSRTLLSSVLRLLRLLGLFIAIILPGLSIAVITYSHEMMPGVLLQTLITATQKMPLPMGAEILFLITMFDLLEEAGLRMPKTVGSAITIVGALVIGDAAVKAGIVSAPAVIIVAITAVASFLLPTIHEFIYIYRFFFIFLGGTMGLVGISTGVVILLTQLASTESFGIPILSSFSKNELMDSILRFPLKSLKYRPAAIAKNNKRRIK